MSCNTQENAIKDLIRQGIIDDSRLLQTGKGDALEAANKEFADIAKEHYQIEGDPFFTIETTVKPRSENPRRPTSIIKRVIANIRMFQLLDDAVNSVVEVKQPLQNKKLKSITPAVNIIDYRTMDDKSKEDAMNGVEEAQKRWVEEEVAEFYEAVEQYNKGLDTFSSKGVNKGKATMADVIDETLGIFRTVQMFPEFSDSILPYLNDIKTALNTFGRKEGYAIYKAKKDAKGQAKEMTYENLFEVVDKFIKPTTIIKPGVQELFDSKESSVKIPKGLPLLGDQLTFFQLHTPTILDTIIDKAAEPALLSKYLTPNTYQSTLSNYGFSVAEIEYLISPLKANPNLWMNAPNIHNLISWKSQEQLSFNHTETAKKANAALDARMMEFLKPLNITVTEVDSLKKRFGVNSLGIAAIVDKAIYLAKDRLLTTLPEEVAHFYVELLEKKNSKDDLTSYRLYKDLMDKIEDWDGYKAVYKEYNKQYGGNLEHIKKEAIAKAISQAIADRWSAEGNTFKQLVLEAIAWLKERLGAQKNFDIKLLADDIATEILNQDYKNIKKDLSETATLTDYKNATPEIRELMDMFSALGAYSTGSIPLRKQGDIYREPSEEFHDLDFKVPFYSKDGFLERLHVAVPDIKLRHEFDDRATGNVTTLWDLEYKGKAYAIDFFFDHEPFGFIDGLVSWRDTFEAKRKMGRNKDITDLINYRPRVVPELSPEKLSQAQRERRNLVISRMGEIQNILDIKSEMVDHLVQNQQRLNSLEISLRSSYNEEEKTAIRAEIKKLQEDVSEDDVAAADIMNRLIQFASGHLSEDNFTEETLHYVVDIIQQKYPEMYSQLDSQIVRFKTYGNVVKAYSADPAYKNEDGSVNFAALRKEAITQVLSNTMLEHDEPLDESQANMTFITYAWNKISDFIKSLFGSLPEDIRYTFREAADKILTDPNFIIPEDFVYLGTEIFKAKGVNDILRKFKVARREVARALITDSAKKGSALDSAVRAIRAMIGGATTGAVTGAVASAALGAIGTVPGAFIGAGVALTRHFVAERQAIVDHLQLGKKARFKNNLEQFNYLMGIRAICNLPSPDADYYEILGHTKLGRITGVLAEVAQQFYKNINKDALQETLRKLKAERGTLIHKEIQAILFRLVDPETGLRRAEELPRPVTINTRKDVYEVLLKHLHERLDSYDAGTRFITEQVVFDLTRGYAGTIDFIAIKPNMSVDILDWKSTEIFYYNHATGKVEPRTDVSPFNQDSWRKQIDMYKNALISHGFNDFKLTRAIPISTEWTKQQIIPNRDWSPSNVEHILKGIDIGPVDVKKLPRDKDYLGPVSSLTEDTGNEKINEMLLILDALMQRVKDTPFKGSDRNKKYLEIDSIRKAIREIQLRKTAYNLTHIFSTSFSRYATLAESVPDFMNDLVKGVAFQDEKVTDKIEKYAGELAEAGEFLRVFAGITDIIRTLYGEELTKGQESTLEKLAETEREAARLNSLIKGRMESLMEATARTVDVQSLNSLDFEGRFTDTFLGASRQEEKTLQVAYRLTQAAKQTEIELKTKYHDSIKTVFAGMQAWAKRNNKTLKETEALIYNFESEYLHGEVSKDYYTELEAKANEFFKYKEKVTQSFKDLGYKGTQLATQVSDSLETYMEPWLKENINFAKFKEDYDKQRESYKTYLGTLTFSSDDRIDVQQKNAYLRAWEVKKDALHHPEALVKTNFFVRPNLDKWMSDEYKKLNEAGNKELLDAHSAFIAINIQAIKLGMMEDMYNAKHFFASIEKEATRYKTKKAVSGLSKPIKNFMKWGFESVKTLKFAKMVSEDYAPISESLGTEIDEVSGTRRLYLPVKYARLNAKPGEVKEKETNVALVFAKWATEVARYESLLNYENRMRLLVMLESDKTRVVPTKADGSPLTLADRERGGSEAVFQKERKADASVISTDTKLETFINHYFYGVDPSVDPTWKKYTSSLNDYARTLFLSLKPVLGVANYFGGALSSTIKAGLYASKHDIRVADTILSPVTPSIYNKEMAMEILNIVSPSAEVRSNEDSYSDFIPGLHVKPMDVLMFHFKVSDNAIKGRIGLAALMNTAVIDGKLVNIPIYVRRNFTDKIDERIIELRKSNILKTAKKNADGKWEIQGIDLKTNEAKTSLMRVRLLIEGMTDDALGNMTGNDASYMDLNYYVSSTILPFKKWLPSQAAGRYGQDTYDWKRDQAHLGRWKTAFRAMAAYGKTRSAFLGLLLLPLGSVRRRTGILNPADAVRSLPEVQAAAKLAYVDMLEYYRLRKSDVPISEAEFTEAYIGAVDGTISEIGTIINLAIFMQLATFAFHSMGDDKKWYQPTIQKMWFQLWQEITNLGSPSALVYTLQHALPTLGVIQVAWDALASIAELGVGEMEQLIPSEYWKYQGMKKVQAAHPVYKVLQAIPIVRPINQGLINVRPDIGKKEGAPPPNYKQR